MSSPPPLPPSSAPAADAAPTACVSCGSIQFSTQTKLPVCEPCRIALVRFPFPRWVKLSAAVVAVMVLTSLALSRERVQSALHLARTQKLVRLERWEEAFQNYRGLMGAHSDTEMVLDYAEAAAKSGHPQEAMQALNSLTGRKVGKEQERRYNTLVYQLQQAQRQPVMPLMPLNTKPIRL